MLKLNKLTSAILAGSLLLAGCSGEDGERGPIGPKGPKGDAAPVDQSLSLTILHMNDHHSHIAPDTFDYDVSNESLNAKDAKDAPIKDVEVTYGGFPMLVNLFDTLESQNENVLKLHSGDAITGTLYYTLFKGSADAEMMNQVCFDAFALGNHEFDDGDKGLANFLDALNSSACVTPALAANVTPAANSAIKDGYIQPYTIVERSGQKIGLIGVDIAQKTKNSSFPDAGTTFQDETTTAQKYIDELKGKGVNKIILMTHYQYANDLTLASNLSGVDVIVGGDSHTLLGDDTFKNLGFNPVADYPTQATDKDGKKVCVVQAWEYAHIMGKLDVSFDANGDVISCGGKPYMPISSSMKYLFEERDKEKGGDVIKELSPEDAWVITKKLTKKGNEEIVLTEADATAQNVLSNYSKAVDILKKTVIGTVSTDLCLERWPGQGRSTICNVSATYAKGSDISNIVAKVFMKSTPESDLSIQNAGGVRVDVKSGDFTIGDAYTLLPFSNTLVVLEMTGQEIKNVLEEALANTLDNKGSSGSYPYASGLRYNIDASKAKGERVTNVQVNPRVAGEWANIDMATTYKVVTNNFIASGKDGYLTFGTVAKAGKLTDTYTEYAQTFVNYVKALTEQNKTVEKLPSDEYSTQVYIGRDGCNHSTDANCTGY